jgi:AcrR family transcriptional regulator
MARWEPNALERLHRAAIELFAERGYDNTTAAEIAERAGLAKSTFFRLFPDKREALFQGQSLLNEMLSQMVKAAPPETTPLEAIGTALAAAEAVFSPERRAAIRQRQEIIDAHGELRERELVKRAALTQSLADALRHRGVPDPTATVAAEVGDLALAMAFSRWLAADNQSAFADLTRQALDDLRRVLPDLG